MNSIGYHSFRLPRWQLYTKLLLNMKTCFLAQSHLMRLEGISLTGFSVCAGEVLNTLSQGKLLAHLLTRLMIMVSVCPQLTHLWRRNLQFFPSLYEFPQGGF